MHAWLSRWAAMVLAHPWRVLLVHSVLLFAAVSAVVGWLRIDTDTSAMLSAKLDWRQQQIALEQAFPDYRNGSLVVVRAATQQRANDAAAALRATLLANTLVTKAFTQEADPTLRQQGLMLMPAAQFENTAEALIAAQPLLARLQQNPHLAGFAELLQQAADNDRAALEPVLAALTDSLQSQPAAAVDWRSLLANQAAPAQAIITVDHPPAKGREILAAVRGAITETQSNYSEPFSALLTGPLPLRVEELTAAADGAAIAAALTLLAVVAMLWIGLRSLPMVLASLLTIVVGLGLTAGFAAIAVGHLNLISVAFSALFIGLAVDYVVHLCMHVRAELRGGHARDEAIASAVIRIGPSLALCTLTTTTAFFAFLLTSYRGIAELGLIAGVGVVLGLLVSLSLLPALLKLLLPEHHTATEANPKNAVSATQKHDRAVRYAAVALAGVGTWLALDMQFAYNPIDLKPPQAESVRAHGALLDGADAPLRAEVLADNAEQAVKLRNALTALEQVQRVDSIDRLLPNDAETRLQQLDDLALVLGGVLSKPLVLQPLPANTREALTALQAQVAEQHSGLAQGLDQWLDANPGQSAVAALQHAWLGDLPSVLALLGDGLNGQAMTLEQLPAHLPNQWVTASGKQRLAIVPSKPLDSNAALVEFVDAVQTAAPHAVGAPVVYRKAGLAVQRAFVEAFAAALLCIAALLWLVLRNLADVLRVLVPLLLGSVLLLACAAQLPIPLNFANIIALPLLLGIAVDNGIHVLLRLRNPASPPLLQTATGKAVVLSALTTLASFAALGFSAHRGMASMGQLLALGLVICVLCTLAVLPAVRPRAS